ncbi:MAG TPA: phosphoenolpyruvate carboxykinase (GTP) [Gammaproteobacteria bacterium]|nr:phosphoenolpyruvate carboxykinase (GTP) [Gammaproteobacteria bacterium]
MAAPRHEVVSDARRPAAVKDWVADVAALTQPDRIVWCDGPRAELEQRLRSELLGGGGLLEVDQAAFPGCHLHRSDPSDVARVEHLTFVCTRTKADAGPNNNWMDPAAARAKMRALFNGCMRGRTLYVVPYCMGPIDSPYARCGVEITDSAYVVLNMLIMTRVGSAALERIGREGTFVRGLHSIGELDPERRFIMHYPEDLAIESFGSGYGGNALLGKKCHALRIASWQARDEGWLAEHMLIAGLTSPRGETHYIAAAFPSACGKTNLAMLIPPDSMPGWKVTTLGDDIAWLHPGPDGRLWAINPEAGYFGVAPGTSPKTNRNAFEMIRRDTIFTNVALTAGGEPWWEGMETGKPAIDWQGRAYDPKNGPAAHPNSRFTVAATQNPSYSEQADAPAGVPISALIFGGRRRELAPLVYEARDWVHGVLVGASVASETTAAATGQVGVVRRDPMAMKPFCGYNFADYWTHWLNVGGVLSKAPRIFHVNWFRRGSSGEFLWPGFGENLRVLSWIIERCAGRAGAEETPIGYLPRPADLDVHGLDIAPDVLRELTTVRPELWRKEIEDIGRYFDEFGERLPPRLRAAVNDVAKRLGA